MNHLLSPRVAYSSSAARAYPLDGRSSRRIGGSLLTRGGAPVAVHRGPQRVPEKSEPRHLVGYPLDGLSSILSLGQILATSWLHLR